MAHHSVFIEDGHRQLVESQFLDPRQMAEDADYDLRPVPGLFSQDSLFFEYSSVSDHGFLHGQEVPTNIPVHGSEVFE